MKTSARHRLTEYQTPLLMGVFFGIWVVLDPLIVSGLTLSMERFRFLNEIPYISTLALATIASLFCISRLNWHSIQHYRGPILVTFTMVSSHLVALGVGPVNPLSVSVLLILALWVYEQLSSPQRTMRFTAFNTLTILFFVAMLISTLNHHPADVFEGIIKTLPKLLLAWLLVDIIDEKYKARLAIKAVLWAAVLAALAGIAQVGVYYFFQLEYTLANENFKYVMTPIGPLLRASGLSLTANQFAPPIAVAGVMALYLGICRVTVMNRLILFPIALLCFAAVGLSIVRGTWIATLFAILCISFIAKPRWSFHWFSLAILVVAIAILTGFLSWAIKSVVGISESGVGERIILLTTGIDAMLNNPLTGLGIYNFGSVSPSLERYPVHNAMIQVGSELGITGFLVFLGMLVYLPVRIVRAKLKAHDRTDVNLLSALLVGYIALFVAIQAEPMAYSQFVWIYFALAEATARCIENENEVRALG